MTVRLHFNRCWRDQNVRQAGIPSLRSCFALTVPPTPTVARALQAGQEGPPTYCDQNCSLEGWRRPLSSGGSSEPPDGPPMVALGKFDALHRGHQALVAAAAQMGGPPWLVSFAGMASILGWPSRLPLVASCDRRRVLRTWTEVCNGQTPRECAIPFADVRNMEPEEFVRLLALELKVGGVAVGSNYRFGYRARGNAELLQQLGAQYGIKVSVVDLVGGSCEDSGTAVATSDIDHAVGAVSSSRVRHALASGDLDIVEWCLGRPYRLVVDVRDSKATYQGSCSLPNAAFNNQPPAPGQYRVRAGLASPDTIFHTENGVELTIAISDDTLYMLEVPPDWQWDNKRTKLWLEFTLAGGKS